MAETNMARIEETPGWYLMTEFVITKLSQNKWSLKNQIMEAIQVLNIPPALFEQIYEVTIQTLNSLERSAKSGDCLPVVRIRILTSASKAEGGGWGFFLVVKSGSESPQNTVEALYLVDMFLYQEHGPDIEGC